MMDISNISSYDYDYYPDIDNITDEMIDDVDEHKEDSILRILRILKFTMSA